MLRQMTVEDYDTERERILSDGRYSFELQMSLIFQLLDTFKEINGCLPHEMAAVAEFKTHKVSLAKWYNPFTWGKHEIKYIYPFQLFDVNLEMKYIVPKSSESIEVQYMGIEE